MKKVLILLITFMLLSNNVLAQEGIGIKLRGTSVNFTEDSGYPFIDENNRTQVPFRVTMEEFGAEVLWDQTTKTAIAIKDGIKVEVPLGESYILVNGEQLENDAPAVNKGGRVYLPIRIVMESFGADVGWDQETRSVTIDTKNLSGTVMGNHGEYANVDDYIFYVNWMESVQLSRAKIDGSENIVLFNNGKENSFGNINIWQDKLYFTRKDSFWDTDGQIYVMNFDGTGSKVLYDGDVNHMEIYDGRIYFDQSDGRIISLDLEGGSKNTVKEDDVEIYFKIYDGWIYYREIIELDTEEYEVDINMRKIRIDGTDDQLITETEVFSWVVVNGWIYHQIKDVAGLFMTKVDGSVQVQLNTLPVGDLKIHGDYLYFRDRTTAYVEKIKLDGTERTVLTYDTTSYIFDVVGDYIYYDNFSPIEAYRVHIESLEKEVFAPWTTGKTPANRD